jgi:RNA polymerase sigma-70 factor, ECF subfamily
MQLAISSARFDLAAVGDETLVGLARNGDEAAIRTLIKRHNQRLFRVARGVVRDDAEAEDIVQETYVRAFTNLHSFRGEALLSTWLTRIALNEALGRVRRRRPRAELAELDTGNGVNEGSLTMFPSLMPANPETEAARGQVRQLLEHFVDRLPDPFRMVFILRDVQGLSIEETATQLSIKAETVKTRLHRARKMMRAAIEERCSAAFSELFPFDGERCVRMADRVVERLRDQGRVER